MRVRATPKRDRGRARSDREMQTAQSVAGDLIIVQQQSQLLGRFSSVASFHKTGPRDIDPLPPLHDVVLSWMGPNGFVLSGIEEIDGVTYAQSWWCRPQSN
jgi:hypothetical protein